MNKINIIVGMWVVVLFSGCGSEPFEHRTLELLPYTYDFSDSEHGWEADFTDYPASPQPHQDSVYQWDFGYEATPHFGGRKALKLSSNNQSGDVFMFIKKKITGFEPNTNYTIAFEVELATNAVMGQNVILKAGATGTEPKKVIEGSNYVLNIDKGSYLNPGEDVIILGDIGEYQDGREFSISVVNNASTYSPFEVKSNSNGELWIIIGTDSEYQGVTTVYYSKAKIVFSVSK